MAKKPLKLPQRAKDLEYGDRRSQFLKRQMPTTAAEKSAAHEKYIKELYKRSNPSKLPKIAGAAARGVARVAGPVGALVAMTTPAGKGSDKPSGPLMHPKQGGVRASQNVKKPKPQMPNVYGSKMSNSPSTRERLPGAPRKAAEAPRKAGGMSFTPALPKAASEAPKVRTSGPRTRAPLSKPVNVPTSGPKTRGFSKGSTKPAYQPAGESQKRGEVTSTKMSSFERAEVARAERDYGGRKLTRQQAVAAVVSRRKK